MQYYKVSIIKIQIRIKIILELIFVIINLKKKVVKFYILK